jgi:bacterioferritin (cytochrome b1)
MAENKKDPMDVDGAVAALNAALRLQFRSALAYTIVAGRMTGYAYHGLAVDMKRFAIADLEDARHLVEKVATLGGEAQVEVADLADHERPSDAVTWLIEAETEAIEALQDCIPFTGQEGRSEAMEHRLEHIIMRKQEQVDALIRASRAG